METYGGKTMDISGKYPIIIDGRETGELQVSREGLFWSFEGTSQMNDGIIRLSVFGEEGEGYLGVMEPRDKRLWLKKRLSRNAVTDFPTHITHAGEPGTAAFVPLKKEEASAETVDSLEESHLSHNSPTLQATMEPLATAIPDSPPPILPAQPLNDTPNSKSHIEPSMSTLHRIDEPPREMKIHRPGIPSGKIPPTTTPASTANSKKHNPLIWKMCPCPATLLSDAEGKSLLGAQQNVLEAAEGEITHLAIPEKTAQIPESLQQYFENSAVILGEKYQLCRIENGKLI